jgi:hypothetical protein
MIREAVLILGIVPCYSRGRISAKTTGEPVRRYVLSAVR